jgi:hypothetical protein
MAGEDRKKNQIKKEGRRAFSFVCLFFMQSAEFVNNPLIRVLHPFIGLMHADKDVLVSSVEQSSAGLPLVQVHIVGPRPLSVFTVNADAAVRAGDWPTCDMVDVVTVLRTVIDPSIRTRRDVRLFLAYLLSLPGVDAIEYIAVTHEHQKFFMLAWPDVFVCQTPSAHTAIACDFIIFKRSLSVLLSDTMIMEKR